MNATATTARMTDTELTILGVKVVRDEDGAEYTFQGVTVTQRDHGGYLVTYADLALAATDSRWIDATPERVLAYELPGDEITWADRDAAILTALATL